MKKLFFAINFALLILTISFTSCGKRCADPEANNSAEKGDCIYPADEFKGTYAVTCNCSPQSGTGSGGAINKSFDLELTKVDNNHVAVKNLQGCSGSTNVLLIVKTYDTNIVGLSSICDGNSYTISGSMNLVPASGELNLSYTMAGTGLGVTWYNCTATGTRK